MKVSTRDIIGVLRRFEVANEDNYARQVDMVKISHPSPTNTLYSFRFQIKQYYLLFDETANDDKYYIVGQIKRVDNNVHGELLRNPSDHKTFFGIPYKGKSCYLFSIIPLKTRLDAVLTAKYPENSRSTWQKRIKLGQISVNGIQITSPKFEVSEADSIEIYTPKSPDYSMETLPTIYLDDNVIVINKPVGVLTHSKGALNEEFTVAEFFSRYTSYNCNTNRPGIVHRLDRDTSGVLVGARNPETAVLLAKQFAGRTVKKTYLAIVVGHPKLDKANIDLPIERNPSNPSSFRVGAAGKPAITAYEVIASSDKYSLVKLTPKTGRTHQLRVHMAYIGTPILGDKVYGKVALRMYLHAFSLEITIPTGRKTFVAQMPNEFKEYFPEVNT